MFSCGQWDLGQMCFRKITPEAPGRWIVMKGEDQRLRGTFKMVMMKFKANHSRIKPRETGIILRGQTVESRYESSALT